jgi:hypothetical protein
MGSWPMIEGQRYASSGSPSASRGTAIASSTGSKGSWVQLIASVLFDSQALMLNLQTQAAGPKDWLVDIGVGGAGSEVVLIPNLLVTAVGSVNYWPLFVPVGVPAGTRLAARAQSLTGGSLNVMATLMAQSFLPSAPLQRVTDYGTDLAGTGGVEVDPGGTVNTKGAWSELSAATTNAMRALFVGIGNQGSVNRLGANFLFDIGVGAAGSEVVLWPDLQARTSTPPVSGVTPSHTPMFGPTVPVSVPAGVRLAARAACSINTDTNQERRMDVIAYGID